MTPSRPNPESLVQPPKLPELELLERIGVGGYGEVWLCRNALGALRAVKIVRRAEFEDDRPYEREFSGIRKFEPISRSHDGFVDLLQVGRNDAEGWFYYVMELADAMDPAPAAYSPRTIGAEVKRRGALPVDECVQIGLLLTRALAELHRHELVHRDIKPSNIIFVGDVPKLADIGLVASATDSRSFVGTEGFIPPEGPGTPPADIYSLGIVLYMMATGKGHRDFPEPPSDLSTRPDRERFLELSAVIHKACQANPRDRYAGARALVADFERLDAGHSVKRHHALQRGWAWSWKAAFVLALSGLGVLLVKNQRDSRATITKLNASPFAKSGATNYAAWEAQQRGLFMARTYTSIGFSNAIQEFERAVAVDPNYVRGWVVLSSYVFLSGFYGYIPGGEAATRARTCAETALKLEPNEAGPLFMLAECNLALDYDFARAEPLFRKAIQMNPTFDVLRENFAARLWYYGHFQEAEEMLQRVIHEAGAGSAEGYTSAGYSGATLGQTYGAQGRYEEALAALDEAIRLEPYRPDAYFSRADLQWAIGRRAEAARDWLRFVQLNGFASLSQTDAAPLEKALSEGGPDEFLRRLIELLEQRRAQGHFVSAYDLARLDAHLGKKTRALDYLELAADEHRTYALSAKVHVAFKGLHDEPRYHAVLRRLKLEQ